MADAKGQSILEVMVVFPFLMTLIILLFRFNMALQMAINNIQFARSQLYMLTYYSPEYPRLGIRHYNGPMSFHTRNMDLMLLGVADPTAIDESGGGDGLLPIPQTQRVGSRGLPGVSSAEGEGHLRSVVSVRETSAICTQKNGVNSGKPYDSSGALSLGVQRWPFGKLPCQYEGQWIGGLNE